MIESARYLGLAIRDYAFALGRRSSLARSLVRNWRNRALAKKEPPNFIAEELDALLAFLRKSGCTFHSCATLGQNPVQRGVAFRYDVHARDIDGCRTFIERHKALRIPATFFLFWDYSSHEKLLLPQFGALARQITSPLELGLHDSPVDSYLIRTRFEGHGPNYANWMRTDKARRWFQTLARDEQKLSTLNSQVLQDFAARVQRTKQQFGTILTVAAHGGTILQEFRDRRSELDPDVDRVVQELTAKTWLTPERVTAAGLQCAVDSFAAREVPWRQISDGGGKLVTMANVLESALCDKKMAVQLLLHPYTWRGGKRDGELCRLLDHNPSKNTGRTSSASKRTTNPSSNRTDSELFHVRVPDINADCQRGCGVFLERWETWFEKTFQAQKLAGDEPTCMVSDADAATLVIPSSISEYDSEMMGGKARNARRKAEKNGYSFAEIDLADHLSDIHTINTSTVVRQGRPMAPSYREMPTYKPRKSGKSCDYHRIRDFGILKDNTLVAYCRLAVIGELAVIDRVLGHFDHLTFGVMDLLVREMVRTLLIEGRRVRALNYLHIASATAGLTSFKKSVGFSPHRLVWTKVDHIPEDTASRSSLKTAKPDLSTKNRLREIVESGAVKKIIMRGDCCSWRTVVKNPKLFGIKPGQIIRDQKAPTIVYLDHLKGISYPDDLLISHSSLDAMPRSLRQYYVDQNKCRTLHARGGDLLVMDSYADAMFQLYEHRTSGAKLWVNPKYLKHRIAFEAAHVKLPRRTLDECLQDVSAYIEHIRTNNPGIPVLYLTQPIHFYAPLYSRREFCLLGAELERSVPDVYWGGHLSPEELSPDDMDSCGPGQTLHFMAETYARMVKNAMGLSCATESSL